VTIDDTDDAPEHERVEQMEWLQLHQEHVLREAVREYYEAKWLADKQRPLIVFTAVWYTAAIVGLLLLY
jgi:hypothetical protein